MINILKYEQYTKEPFAACENPQVPKGKWLLEHLPKKPANLLDVGCGTGVHTKFFNAQGIDAHGITINPDEIAKRVHKNVGYGNMLDIPFDNKFFDCVFCLGTFEHTHSPFIALCEFNRVLKDNGYLFLDMCSIRSTYIMNKQFYYHKSVLFPIQVKDLLLRTGFYLTHSDGADIIEGDVYEAPIRNSRYLAKKCKSNDNKRLY